jgi:pilus assembly protein Flp/PilA
MTVSADLFYSEIHKGALSEARVMVNCMKRFGRSEHGATGIEYGIIAAFIAITIIAAVKIVGSETATSFSNATDGLANAAP